MVKTEVMSLEYQTEMSTSPSAPGREAQRGQSQSTRWDDDHSTLLVVLNAKKLESAVTIAPDRKPPADQVPPRVG